MTTCSEVPQRGVWLGDRWEYLGYSKLCAVIAEKPQFDLRDLLALSEMPNISRRVDGSLKE